MRRNLFLTLSIALLLLTPLAFGQQAHVAGYDFNAGYGFLDGPRIGLFENGVQMQIGIRPKTWYSVGSDYSYSRGDLSITPDVLPDALQTSLKGTLGQL